MKLITLSICIMTGLIIVGCSFFIADGIEMRGPEAESLIRRNLLLEKSPFPIDTPLAFQYGNVHVDGPSGGILYRFEGSPELMIWFAEQHDLTEFSIDSADQLPLDFLTEVPRWWDPWEKNPSAYYRFVEDLTLGGERILIVVFDSSTGVFYFVEHFSNVPGI